ERRSRDHHGPATHRVGKSSVRYGTMMIAAAALGVAMPASAASVAPDKNASGKALVLVPLTLTKVDDLDFGTLVPSAVSGFVSINATTGNRTVGGGVTGVSSDTGHRALFAGAGTPNQLVLVTMTQPTELTDPAGD